MAELLPAITGEHAPPPDGPGYDWAAVAGACEQMAATVPVMQEVRGRAPDDLTAIGELIDLYVPDLQAFTTACTAAAATEDTEALRAEVDRTARIAQVLAEVQQAIEQRSGG
ncbi:MAG: hypothetical protein H0W25_14190 [Acidimicrobiia bacterium]|nr:hypothetical protein [Acidimicrobiia bacterium]